MGTRNLFKTSAAAVIVLAAVSTVRGAIMLGQVDSFEDGTTMGWIHGPASPVPPSVTIGGGPNGPNDHFLQNFSTGTSGSGGRHIMFNQDQWTGDFVAAGVTEVRAWVRNGSSSDLYLRIAAEGDFNERWGSTNPILVPTAGTWQPITFDLRPAAMTRVSGTDSLATVLSSVGEFRILSSQAGANWIGDRMVGILLIDDITAAPEPGALALLTLGAGVVLRRRR